MCKLKGRIPSFEVSCLRGLFLLNIDLSFPYPEHFGPACWACTLGRRLTILHSYGLRGFHILFRFTLNTIRLYHFCLLYIDFSMNNILFHA